MRVQILQNLLRAKKLLCEHSKTYTNNVVTYSLLRQVKSFSTGNQKYIKNDSQNESHNLAGSISVTHKVFEDDTIEIALDNGERQETINIEDLRIDEPDTDPFEGLNLEHGVNGVFDIEDLIAVLQKDQARNIFVAKVPPELGYIDYIVVATAKSQKHMKALASFVYKIYKLKKHEGDLIPKIEGKNSRDWVALDFGNIALHIFSRTARDNYDLETLWSVGPEWDDKSRITVNDPMKQYNEFLSEFEPLENDEDSQLTKNKNS